jgi:ABC-type antimicrobial peptide transport system, ATPase component
MTARPALIELRSVTKRYPPCHSPVYALQSVSVKIWPGELIAVVGSSGSGKSTLMNIVGCLDIPSSGRYYLDGQPVAALSDSNLSQIRNQQIGFVFQGFNLVPSLNAIENVELPLLYRGLPREQRRALAFAALEQVGLAGRVHHRPAQLSGGQQQRVAIARAIAARPPIILADEPTGNLDSASSADVLSILQALWQAGKTVILITHDRSVAKKARRIIRMQDGRIISDSANSQNPLPSRNAQVV